MSSVNRILVTGGPASSAPTSANCSSSGGMTSFAWTTSSPARSRTSPTCSISPNFELIRHDITLPIFLEVDEIYNLACPAAPGHYQYNPIKTMKTSVMGAINVLGMAKRCRAKVLQASTSEVYGDPEVHPQPESYRGRSIRIGPRACYDEGKRAAETLFMDYHRQNRVNVRIVRIFNTYGPRMHPFDGRVISNFICQALAGRDITIFGDGSQTRSFCYRDDLIEGIIRMMDGPDDFVGPVNLGNPEEFTILELARLVLELTGSSSKLVFRPLPIDDPTQRQPDITLAKKHLDWQPKVSLREGLLKTIEWFRSIESEPLPPADSQLLVTSTNTDFSISAMAGGWNGLARSRSTGPARRRNRSGVPFPSWTAPTGVSMAVPRRKDNGPVAADCPSDGRSPTARCDSS